MTSAASSRASATNFMEESKPFFLNLAKRRPIQWESWILYLSHLWDSGHGFRAASISLKGIGLRRFQDSLCSWGSGSPTPSLALSCGPTTSVLKFIVQWGKSFQWKRWIETQEKKTGLIAKNSGRVTFLESTKRNQKRLSKESRRQKRSMTTWMSTTEAIKTTLVLSRRLMWDPTKWASMKMLTRKNSSMTKCPPWVVCRRLILEQTKIMEKTMHQRQKQVPIQRLTSKIIPAVAQPSWRRKTWEWTKTMTWREIWKVPQKEQTLKNTPITDIWGLVSQGKIESDIWLRIGVILKEKHLN